MNDRSVEIDVDDVIVGPRLRDVDPARVAAIAASMKQVGGQIVPVEVGPRNTDGKYPLISGAHRLDAARRAGLTTVLAVVFDGNVDEIRLREIDENLMRHDLSPYDQAAFMVERLTVWERLYEQRMARGRPSKENSAKLARAVGRRFYDEVATAFGTPRRTAQRALARWEKIDRDAWAMLRGEDVTRNGSDLDALMRLKADEQRKVAKLIAGGDVATVAQAKKRLGIGQKIDPQLGHEKWVEKIRNLVRDAPPAAWTDAIDREREFFNALFGKKKS